MAKTLTKNSTKTTSIFARFDRPVVLGHRGVPEDHQENTLSGFKKAIELGIDGVELDVILSKDQELVVFHDDTLERMIGAQHPESSRSITDIYWQQLKQLEIQTSINVGSRTIDYGKNERLCLLENVLEEVKDKLIINIELKGVHPATGQKTAELVQKMSLESDVFVTSFHAQPLQALKVICPTIEAGIALTNGGDYLQTIALTNSSLSSMNRDMLNQDVIEQLHNNSCSIGSWTFFAQEPKYFKDFHSEAEEINRIKELQCFGIDFMITDEPVKLVQVLEK